MVILHNRLNGEDETAELVSPIVQMDVDCYQTYWRPILDAKVEELKQRGEYTRAGVRQHNIEDAHWRWPEKVIDRANQLQWNSYAVRCGGRTQGMMFVDTLKRCRLASQANGHMIYIDLLSTAPWNRPALEQKPIYRGVGIVLITEAILQSQDEGFGGRIGLHSLPRAEPFYRDALGMESLGPDPNYDNLLYFEMTEDRAAGFLEP